MSLIQINNLTFSYPTSYDAIFKNATFQMDTDWKLGLIGRNGRGKTTLLKLLEGCYPYEGTIVSSVKFDYFPFEVTGSVRDAIAPFSLWENQMRSYLEESARQDISEECRQDALNKYSQVLDLYVANDGYSIDELLKTEIARLGVTPEVLSRPWETLSGGEQVKLMLAALFLKKNHFLLIDEPTNHMDAEGREIVTEYLKSKKGFILVSHDRYLLDQVVDHIVSINRNTIDVQKGNYSTWLENKEREDAFEKEQNEHLKKDITRLEAAARRTADWSDQVEKTKIGCTGDKGRIGHLAAKMMKRSKSLEARQLKAIEEKSALMKNLEQHAPLKLHLLDYPKKRLLEARGLSICYDGVPLFEPLNFSLSAGERLLFAGKNGCGKSSLIKLILQQAGKKDYGIQFQGELQVGNNMVISFIDQNTSFLQGSFRDFCQDNKLDESLFKAILRKLDFSRIQFEKNLDELSEGQKKKVLIAYSLCIPAHLYIWDEPLNFIDLLSRSQIEEVLLRESPTLIFVDHDRFFQDKIATNSIEINRLHPLF